MNYCVDFSTCLYYELTNYKIGLLKPRNTATSNRTLYKIQVKQIPNTECQNCNKYLDKLNICYT